MLDVFLLMVLSGGISALAKLRKVNAYLAVAGLLMVTLAGGFVGARFYLHSVRGPISVGQALLYLYGGAALGAGLVYLGVWSLPVPPEPAIQDSTPEGHDCPGCGNQLPPGAALCRHCGRWAD